MLAKPRGESHFYEGFFPAYILFQRFHLGIENCNLFIEKKEVNMQSSYFKFSPISLPKDPIQSQLKILAFNVCWEETKHMTERCTSRKATISISLMFKEEYVSSCHFKTPVAGFWGENMNLSSISGTATGLLGQCSFPLYVFPHL